MSQAVKTSSVNIYCPSTSFRTQRIIEKRPMAPRNNGSAKMVINKGAWTTEEDKKLMQCIQVHGEKRWRLVPAKAGLNRCGKSCRLRWLNYLRPSIKRGNISDQEEDLIIRLHKLLGNRWSLIAGRLPGRTDNEIKNYWNSHLSKRKSNPCKENRAFREEARALGKGHLEVSKSSPLCRVDDDFNVEDFFNFQQDERMGLGDILGSNDEKKTMERLDGSFVSNRGPWNLDWLRELLELDEGVKREEEKMSFGSFS